MAKAKVKVNKSAAIRAYMAANPGQSVTEIIAGVAKQGVKVTAASVYNLRGKKVKRGGGRWKKHRAAKATPAPSEVTVEDLLAVKTVGRSLGPDKAIAALHMLKKLDLVPA